MSKGGVKGMILKVAVFASVGLSMACLSCALAGSPKDTKPPDAMRVKLMSFNVRMGCGHSDPFRLEKGDEGYLPKCAEVIRFFDPDCAGLQEVDRNSKRAGFLDQTQVLARHTGMHGDWVEKIPRYGISMLSKRKPVSVEKVLMPGQIHTRVLMICDYGCYVVANTHFPLSEAKRIEAAKTVKKSLKGLALRKPVFLMGDFNALPESPEMLLLKEDFKVLTDESVPTWPTKRPKRTIDYIMIDKAHAVGVEILSKCAFPAPGATDHSALAVEVAVIDAESKEKRK